MREFEIQLSSVQDVQAFVALATTCPFPVFLKDGNHKINGKSFMEMFCLDFARPVRVCAECAEVEFEALRAAARRFLVK